MKKCRRIYTHSRSEKITPIRLITVRGTSVPASWGTQLRGPLRTSQQYHIEGLKRGSYFFPIMPQTSLSDNQSKFCCLDSPHISGVTGSPYDEWERQQWGSHDTAEIDGELQPVSRPLTAEISGHHRDHYTNDDQL